MKAGMKTIIAPAVSIALMGLWALVPALGQTEYSFRPNSLAIDDNGNGGKTATAVAGAVTLNKNAGVITTEALTTAAAGIYALTITNSTIVATDSVFASVSLASSTTGAPSITGIKNSAGSVVIYIQNSGSAAFNGTLRVAFFVLKQ